MFEDLKVRYCKQLGVVYYLDWVQVKLAYLVLLVAIVEQDFELASMVEALKQVVMVVGSSLWVEMYQQIEW